MAALSGDISGVGVTAAFNCNVLPYRVSLYNHAGPEETGMRKLLFILLALGVISPAAQALSPKELTQHTIERRAVEAVIWGIPAVNYDLMLQEMLTKTKGGVDQIVYWSRPLDWHNQTLTPNPDAIYLMAFTNTKDVGPVVIEVPPDQKSNLGNPHVDPTPYDDWYLRADIL
jgi:hypothetical protein